MITASRLGQGSGCCIDLWVSTQSNCPLTVSMTVVVKWGGHSHVSDGREGRLGGEGIERKKRWRQKRV